MQNIVVNSSVKRIYLVNVPVIACGGCWTLEHIEKVFRNTSAHSVSAGSMFVFKGSRDGVLINYPSNTVLEEFFKKMGHD